MAERPVRALRFQGFLGIWGWPLMNLFLERLGTMRVRGSLMHTSSSTSSSKTTTYANLETYEIFEDKLGVIKVKVHRKAERS